MSDEHIQPTLKIDNFITVSLKFLRFFRMFILRMRWNEETKSENSEEASRYSLLLIFICFIVVI